MRHLTYLAVLAGCLLGALWVEPVLHVHVLRRWRRLAITLAIVVVIFGSWDVAAVAAGHWRYDPAQTLGVRLLGHLPLEELLFFLVIPFAAILGFEAVRAVRGSAAPAGDEVPGTVVIDETSDQVRAVGCRKPQGRPESGDHRGPQGRPESQDRRKPRPGRQPLS